MVAVTGGADLFPLEATSWYCSVTTSAGAVRLGAVPVHGPLHAPVGPEVWVQVYVRPGTGLLVFSVTVVAMVTSWSSTVPGGTGRPTVTLACSGWPAATDTPLVIPSSPIVPPLKASTVMVYIPGSRVSKASFCPCFADWVAEVGPLRVTCPLSTATDAAPGTRAVRNARLPV